MEANMDTFPESVVETFQPKFEETKVSCRNIEDEFNAVYEKIGMGEHVRMSEIQQLRHHIDQTIELALDFGNELTDTLAI